MLAYKHAAREDGVGHNLESVRSQQIKRLIEVRVTQFSFHECVRFMWTAQATNPGRHAICENEPVLRTRPVSSISHTRVTHAISLMRTLCRDRHQSKR
jgi:hypothetical protein